MTGASYGLGAEISKTLARDGFDVGVTELNVNDLSSTLSSIDSENDVQSAGIELDLRSIESIENAIISLNEHVPNWLLNRQKDYDTGEDIHSVSVDLKMTNDEDLNRMKKVKSYRGIRHASGHKVRGQRTYSNGRKGLALGVSRKKGTQS